MKWNTIIKQNRIEYRQNTVNYINKIYRTEKQDTETKQNKLQEQDI